MDKRLTVISLLQQCFEIVEHLNAKEVDVNFKAELLKLKTLISEAIDLLNSDDANKEIDYTKITKLIDWLIRIFTAKEVWDALQ